MENVLHEIKEEHDDARELLDEVEESTMDVDWDTMKELYVSLYGHHEAEEQIVFPAVKDYDQETGRLVEHLIEEHKEAHKVLLGMIDGIKFDRPKFLELKEVLLEHMHQEETTLFKKARNVLTPKQLEEVLEPFEEVEHKEKEVAEKRVGK